MTLYRRFGIVLLIVIVIFNISVDAHARQSAPTVRMSIQLEVNSVNVGDTFSVQVQIDSGSLLVDSAAAHINFDPALLAVTSLVPGGDLPVQVINTFSNTTGQIDFVAGQLTGVRPSGIFTLFSVNLQALGTTTSTPLTFNIGAPRRTDVAYEGTSILTAANGGTVTIGSSALAAGDDVVETLVDTAVTIDILANDTTGSPPLVVVDAETPANGSTSFTISSVSYTPNSGYIGTDTFSYTVTDTDGSTATALVTVNVTTTLSPPTTASVSLPPPVALCVDHNFMENSSIRANVPDAIRSAVFCRPIVASGRYTNAPGEAPLSPANIGIQGVIDLGVRQAVEVFGPSTTAVQNVTICLQGSGTLLHLQGVPRTPHRLTPYPVAAFDGFTCAAIPQFGTVVLVETEP